jgi:WD40 repeat protein
MVLLHNLCYGLEIISLKSQKRQKVFKHGGRPLHIYPLAVAFLHDDTAVISGTNSGEICIWDIKSGDYFQILSHKGGVPKK